MPLEIDEEQLEFTLEKINNLIDDLFDTQNIKAIVVANEDGLPIASRIYTGEPDLEYIISAIFSTIINTGVKMSERLEMGEPLDIMLKLDNGIMIVRVLEERVCCGIILPKSVNIPFFEIKIEEFSKKLIPILFHK